jgi:hypothetical protein
MKPSLSVRNFIPTSAGVVVVACSNTGVSLELQMLHGQLRVDTGGGASRMATSLSFQAAAILS